ncbi:TetR/AcrR family transcriptional regulator [Nocardia terpenica]|uniref:TetR/AcrR family transcriptional regulator n=1 Tax=Nocardia terpenica TaxID=455432 RepID=UPI00189418A3|nr:TetR/AcrR family transcriptional regulator [Nocardia terpenica]MBF6062276.1 TetR/AcrR family transcriptional regulator [Nocardia terpenica]MBF6104364.1 TetR/AcrR family transcriptional regulator [Nocardia terpenica]MBF6109780.1 TetR/AcrR family transcriptional regulator [Nocardia terpenica]MBF6120086.1 TetR/AcrR family transcriptional regulator [Nocardia terpenica]MBF6152497.1 TetR/AcrR family transcriptional regulator [Nocardia terpenica]
MPRRSQEDRSRSTRAALEQAGRRLFAEHGYSGVSAEQIVSAAGVTRGALHHHYGDKRGLFVAVLERLEAENTAEVAAAVDALPDTTDLLAAMAVGLRTFLEINLRPETVRIAMSDGPAVLGWQSWREMEARHGLGMIIDLVQQAVDAGVAVRAPVRVLAQLILSAVTEGGMIVAHAEDPEQARAEVEQSMLLLVGGMLHAP